MTKEPEAQKDRGAPIFGFRHSSFEIRHLYLCLQTIDKFLHCLLLAFNGFDQFELGSAAVKIMSGPMNPEIGVTREIVR
jgi:hypothetical protein